MMRVWCGFLAVVMLLRVGRAEAGVAEVVGDGPSVVSEAAAQGGGDAAEFVGFDRNDYPGDAALAGLRRRFAFVGYWLTNPPGETANGWVGKRAALRAAGFGFLVLANGRLYAEIVRRQKNGTAPSVLGVVDALDAVRAAVADHFPAGATIFLDQEEGGRLISQQADYLLAWTETVARGGFKPGVYASGQPVDEGPKPGGGRMTITTAEDIRARVRAGGLHEVALWVAQDACPPANGCSLKPPAMEASGTDGAAVWQYAQSPRRPEITKACAATYAPDGNCYLPASDGAQFRGMHLDLDVARSADPSGGR